MTEWSPKRFEVDLYRLTRSSTESRSMMRLDAMTIQKLTPRLGPASASEVALELRTLMSVRMNTML